MIVFGKPYLLGVSMAQKLTTITLQHSLHNEWQHQHTQFLQMVLINYDNQFECIEEVYQWCDNVHIDI